MKHISAFPATGQILTPSSTQKLISAHGYREDGQERHWVDDLLDLENLSPKAKTELREDIELELDDRGNLSDYTEDLLKDIFE